MSPPLPVIPTASFLCLVVRIDSLYTWLRWCCHLQQLTKSVGSELISAAILCLDLKLILWQFVPHGWKKLCGSSCVGKLLSPKKWIQHDPTEEILGIYRYFWWYSNTCWVLWNIRRRTLKKHGVYSYSIHTIYMRYTPWHAKSILSFCKELWVLLPQKSNRSVTWVSGNVWRHCLRNLHKGHLLLTWDFEN